MKQESDATSDELEKKLTLMKKQLSEVASDTTASEVTEITMRLQEEMERAKSTLKQADKQRVENLKEITEVRKQLLDLQTVQKEGQNMDIAVLEKQLSKLDVDLTTVDERVTVEVKEREQTIKDIHTRTMEQEQELMDLSDDLDGTESDLQEMASIVKQVVKEKQSAASDETIRKTLETVEKKALSSAKQAIVKKVKNEKEISEKMMKVIRSSITEVQNKIKEEKESRKTSEKSMLDARKAILELSGQVKGMATKGEMDAAKKSITVMQETLSQERLEVTKSQEDLKAVREMMASLNTRLEKEKQRTVKTVEQTEVYESYIETIYE